MNPYPVDWTADALADLAQNSQQLVDTMRARVALPDGGQPMSADGPSHVAVGSQRAKVRAHA